MTFFWIALVPLCAVAAILLRARRHLLVLDAHCEAAAVEVEAGLAGLHALFPALVGLMRAFAPKEREAIDAVAKAHAAAQRTHSPQARLLAETRLADSVRRLLAQARQVDQIKTMSDFNALRLEMEEAERRVAGARRKLSAATDAYNQALTHFPESLFAMRLRLAPRAFYDIGVEQLAEEAV